MTSTSNSKTTSGKNTNTTSPNTYSYQVTSQFGSSGSPASSNSYDAQNLQNMLDYALQSKRVPQKQVIKRELKAQASNQVSSLASEDSGALKSKGPIITPPNIAMKAKPVIQKLPDGAIVIQPTGGELYTGKGKGKRKKKNNKQIQMLEKAYKARNDWNREDIINLAKFTGLTKSQIYKWNWDVRKRGKFTEQEAMNQAQKSKEDSELPFLPGGFGNKTVDLQAEDAAVSDNKSIQQFNKMGSMASETKSSSNKSKSKINQQQPPKNPYLQQLPEVKLFYTGKKGKASRIVKKTNMNVNKKVKALESKFQKIDISSSDSRGGNRTDITPDTQIHSQSLQEQKEKQVQLQKQQPPPSTPVYEEFYQYQNDNKNTANITLLRYRNYSQANFNQEDDTQSVPDIILENEEGQDCEEDITNFIEQRQRSNSMGGVTSQQTQNYLDKFLLDDQSISPYSKKQTAYIQSNHSQNQEYLNYQTSDIRQNNQNTGSLQFKPPSFKQDSFSSGKTAFKFIKNNSIGAAKSQSSESSWKQAFRQPGRGDSASFTQAGINIDQKEGQTAEDALYKLPEDLSAQARIDKQAIEDSIVRSSISSINKMKQAPQNKFTSSITALITLIQAQNQQTDKQGPGMDCVKSEDCMFNCCLYGQCMPNDLFCSQVSEEAKAQIDDLKKELNAQTGAQSECDANWQCQSNCCFLGSCKKSNFMCKNDKNYGQSCFFNDDCNSGCCNNHQCSYYWDCHRVKLDFSEAEIQSFKEDEIDAKTESLSQCDANWQCRSNCCFLGSCKKSNFMCKNDKNIEERCAFDDDCNSGCCKFGVCSQYFSCHYQNQAKETNEVAEIKALQSKQKELELQNQFCAMNWQCSSGCCYQGMCSTQSIMCRKQGELGDLCKDDKSCNSGCCESGICNPFHLCKSTSSLDGQIESPSLQILDKYQTFEFQKYIKQQVALGKNEIGLQRTELWGPCDYNFQCSSSCCLEGTCTLFQFSCGDQNATGNACQQNQDCLSSCCYDDGLTNDKKCSPIEFCTYEKKHEFQHDCKWNAECLSGCCAFGTCRKDMFWCNGQVQEGQDCVFNGDCRSSCCTEGKCSYAMDCYTGKDFLRESNPELMVFYDFLQKFSSQKKSEGIQQDNIKVKNSINLPQTAHYNMTIINPENQRPWYLYVGIVFGVTLLISIIVWTVKNRRKILNICQKKNSMEYSRLIEEEVVGRDRL